MLAELVVSFHWALSWEFSACTAFQPSEESDCFSIWNYPLGPSQESDCFSIWNYPLVLQPDYPRSFVQNSGPSSATLFQESFCASFFWIVMLLHECFCESGSFIATSFSHEPSWVLLFCELHC
jgi:hypothetical protein